MAKNEIKEEKVLNLNILNEITNELSDKELYFVKQDLENKLRIRQQKLLKKMDSNMNKLMGKENAKGVIKGGIFNKAMELKEEKEEAEAEGYFTGSKKKDYITNVLLLLIEANMIEVDQKITQKEYYLNGYILGDRKTQSSGKEKELEGIIASLKHDIKTIKNEGFDFNATEDKKESEYKDKGNISMGSIDGEKEVIDDELKEILGEDAIAGTDERKDIELEGVKIKLNKEDNNEEKGNETDKE